MEKKLLALASSAILMGLITTGFAATPVHAAYSSFKDNVTIHFVGFPQDTVFYASYADNNGVNISGPAFATTDYDASVIISSDNKLNNGSPGMSILYPALFSNEKCQLTFLDGPYLPALAYADGKAPVCPGLNIGDIQKTSEYNYSITITNNEP